MQPKYFNEYRLQGRTVLRMRPAWSSYWGSMIAVAVIVGLWMLQRALFDEVAATLGVPPELPAASLVLALSPILLRVLYHRYTHAYEIEDDRKLRLSAGFIARQKREFPLSDKVQTDVSQSIIARMLNFGTIGFWTGDDRSRLEWHNAPDPDRIVAFLDQLKSGAPVGRKAAEQSDASHADATVASIHPPDLKEAKSSRITHFGRTSESVFKPASEMVAKRLQTPIGAYLDNDDGTVSDEQNGLMFIRAPWGTVWNGDKFVGDPILLKWTEAVGLFGRGADVGYGVGDTMAYMGYAKRTAAAFENGYQAGRCEVQFAGFKDWRLPTADELDRFAPYVHRNSRDGSPSDPKLSTDEKYDWNWKGRSSKPVLMRLYPELEASNAHLWTANSLGGGLAWAYDGSMPPGDHKTDQARAVLFVRSVSPYDLAAGQIVNEDLPE